MSADLPAAVITAAVRDAQAADQDYVRHRKRDGMGWSRVPDEQVARLLTAALPALTAPAAAPFDPMTEPEGFRAYQAGIKAGRADAAQAAADERERIRHRLLDGDPCLLESRLRFLDDEDAADCALVVADLLGGTADGAHTPGGTT